MVAQGGPDSPVIQPMSLHDIGTGTLAAFGTLTALYARTQLGAGQDVGVALSRTSVRSRPPSTRRTRAGRRRASGTSTTWATALRTATSRRPTAGSGSAATTAAQQTTWDAIRGVDDGALADLTVDAVVHACRAAGVPAIAELSRDDVYTSATLAENDCFVTVDDDDLGEVRVIRGYSDWDGVPPRRRAAMHAEGRDTEAVLTPAG